MKISLQRIIGTCLPLFMFVYNLNWKLGAVCNIFLIIIFFFFFLDGTIKKISNLCMLWGGYIAVFAVLLQILRNYELTISYVVGYVLAVMILLKGIDRVTFRYILSSLKKLSIIQAFGIFLQYLMPNIYYAVMSILVEEPTRNSIMFRVQEGYYTGFSREVSLTIVFLIIGVGLFIAELLFDSKSQSSHTKRKIIIEVLILILAILLTGKRGQPLFCLLALLITYLIYSKNRMKVIKILGGTAVFGIIIAATYNYWERIPSLSRFVQLIGNILNNSDVAILTTGRTEIYEAAIKLFEKNKMFGIGWNNFKNSFGSDIWFSRFDVHNCYLQVLCETGYIGATLFYLLVLATIIKVLQCGVLNSNVIRYGKGITPFCIFYTIFFLAYCITGTNLYEYSYYIIFFISVTQIEKELRNHKEKKLLASGGNYEKNFNRRSILRRT